MSQKNLPQPNPKWLHDLKKGRAQGGDPKVADEALPDVVSERLSTGSSGRTASSSSQADMTQDEPDTPAVDRDAAASGSTSGIMAGALARAPAGGLQTATAEPDRPDQLARAFSIAASVQSALRTPHPPRIRSTRSGPTLRTHA